MRLKEIRTIVSEIENDILKNKSNYTYKKYETFFDRIGMLYRRNFKELSRFERQFKNRGIQFWNGRDRIKKLSNFAKGTVITFKQELMDYNNFEGKTKIDFAGTINISESEKTLIPYKHQEEAFYNLQKEIIKSNKNPFSGLLVLPTGGGKTFTAAWWLSKNFLDKGRKVLWVAHRHELLDQAKDSFKSLAYKNIFENKDSFNYRIISGIHDKPINIKPTDDIIIASKDSLNAGFVHLFKKWIYKNIDEVFLVIDEAHHATAKTYRKLINNLKESVSSFKLLGLTATPTRTAQSEKGLLKKVFADDIVYKIDLKTLIRLGILSEPIFEEVQTGQNFIEDLSDEDIEHLNKFDINSIGKKIAETIAKNRERNFSIVERYIKNKDRYKQTLVFALNVDNAIALNALFREKNIKSDYVISNVKDAITGVTTNFTKENKEKIQKFREEELEVLINVNILTEGTDVPNVQTVFLTRPTISTILMTQMIGRGLRGKKAGGTKEAYIVSFVDEWKDQIAWINPEKLFIEENIDFNDIDKETNKQLIRLVSISKIEEFAILADKIIDPQAKKELEELDFIQRIPKGVFQFKYLDESEPDSEDVNCEILVYDNMENSYKNLIETLPYFVKENHIEEREFLSQKELNIYANMIENEFFVGIEKYPAYYIKDIKNLLQYYMVQGTIPQYIELKDREKYNIDNIAQQIYEEDLGRREATELKDNVWNNNEIEWQTFFNYDKRIFLQEIDNSLRRIENPELFQQKSKIPTEEKEIREYEKMPLYEIRKVNPAYEKWLRDQIFENAKDEDGFYVSAESGYKSKNRLKFQIDHIKPMSNGGLTQLDNLQLLTKGENAVKGAKEQMNTISNNS